MDRYEAYNIVDKFEILPAETQEDFLNNIKISSINITSYALFQLLSKINDESIVELVETYFKNNNLSLGYHAKNIFAKIIELAKKEEYKDRVTNAMRESKTLDLNRCLLLLPNFTIEDEIKALRALSSLKSLPSDFFKIRFAPRAAALKELPPIMRLNLLETLTENKNVSYNIFKNLPDPEEFKTILFGAVVKYRDRVENIWNKYNEISLMNREAEAVISGNCQYCGDYRIMINHQRVHTMNNFLNTTIGQWLYASRCPLCGHWQQGKKLFNGQ